MHDSQVDLSIEDEVVIRDRGYFGVPARGNDYWRSPGERPHAVIKRVFGMGMILVTTVKRGHVKMMITVFAYNLYQLCTLKKYQNYSSQHDKFNLHRGGFMCNPHVSHQHARSIIYFGQGCCIEDYN